MTLNLEKVNKEGVDGDGAVVLFVKAQLDFLAYCLHSFHSRHYALQAIGDL